MRVFEIIGLNASQRGIWEGFVINARPWKREFDAWKIKFHVRSSGIEAFGVQFHVRGSGIDPFRVKFPRRGSGIEVFDVEFPPQPSGIGAFSVKFPLRDSGIRPANELHEGLSAAVEGDPGAQDRRGLQFRRLLVKLGAMSETAPTTNPPSEPVQVPARQTGAPVDVLVAMADPVRYAVMKELSDGSYPAVKDLAAKLHCHPDQMGRHLQRMCKAGIVMEVRASEADKRSRYYMVPKEFRRTLPDGTRVLDFGKIVLRF